MEYHDSVLVKRTERSAGLLAGCDADVLVRIYLGPIAKFGFNVVPPLSRPVSIASGGWEAASTADREAGATVSSPAGRRSRWTTNNSVSSWNRRHDRPQRRRLIRPQVEIAAGVCVCTRYDKMGFLEYFLKFFVEVTY